LRATKRAGARLEAFAVLSLLLVGCGKQPLSTCTGGCDANGDADDARSSANHEGAADGGDADRASIAEAGGPTAADGGVEVASDAGADGPAADAADVEVASDVAATAPAVEDGAADGARDADSDQPDGAEAGAVTDAAVIDDASPIDAGPWIRDWTLHPAVFQQQGASRLWGLSDVHGDRDRLIVLLSAAGLIDGSVSPPTWQGGTDTLVVSGDNIDKGPQSVEVLEIWMSLIPQADLAGGHLIVLLGNHEAEFLADPLNSKAVPLVTELPSSEPPASFASADDPHGRFIRERPIAALVDGWFFSHAGNSGGASLDQIGATFQMLVDAAAWSDPFFLDPNSILEARSWWPSGAATNDFLDGYLAALPGDHFVFGHHPTTFADPPSGNIEAHQAGRLVLIDVGMSVAVNYSEGKLLRVDAPGTPQEAASMIAPTGAVTALDLTAP
jgi:hypothetical protein